MVFDLILIGATFVAAFTAMIYGFRYWDLWARYRAAMDAVDVTDNLAARHLARALEAEKAVEVAAAAARAANAQAAEAYRVLEFVLDLDGAAADLEETS